MPIVRVVLIIYCLAATIGLAIWAGSAISRTNSFTQQLRPLQEEIAGKKEVAEAKLQELRQLEAVQREGRRSFSGPEAVDASYAVQVAQEAWDKADAEEQDAAARLQAVLDEQDKSARIITPLIAGVLLHLLLGFALFRSTPRGKHAA